MDEETFFWICIILICAILVSFLMPITRVDDSCYLSIAKKECASRGMDYKQEEPNRYVISSLADFQCCLANITLSRKATESYNLCEPFIFLEEDHEKCLKTYQFWTSRRGN